MGMKNVNYQRTYCVEIGHGKVCRSISIVGWILRTYLGKKVTVTDSPGMINFILCGRTAVNKNFVALQCSENEVLTHINFPKM